MSEKDKIDIYDTDDIDGSDIEIIDFIISNNTSDAGAFSTTIKTSKFKILTDKIYNLNRNRFTGQIDISFDLNIVNLGTKFESHIKNVLCMLLDTDQMLNEYKIYLIEAKILDIKNLPTGIIKLNCEYFKSETKGVSPMKEKSPEEVLAKKYFERIMTRVEENTKEESNTNNKQEDEDFYFITLSNLRHPVISSEVDHYTYSRDTKVENSLITDKKLKDLLTHMYSLDEFASNEIRLTLIKYSNKEYTGIYSCYMSGKIENVDYWRNVIDSAILSILLSTHIDLSKLKI